jgi:transcriptional regulator with PAS, ATPase and Fis domain
VETFRDMRLDDARPLEPLVNLPYASIKTRNPRMQNLLKILPAVAESGKNILIEGERGTGKALLAQAIHDLSLRLHKPFITMNYEALPESLWAQELLGIQTGAEQDRPGKLALANGGTLFLEEAGMIPLSIQAQLKEALHRKSFKPLGAASDMGIDVRVVASASAPLDSAVRTSAFREELYFRLQGIKLVLPPLRERNEDLPRLADLYLTRYKHLHASPTPGMAPETLARLLEHDFPGNDRELEILIEKAVLICGREVIRPEHLPKTLGASCVAETSTEGENLKDVEKIFLVKMLKKHKGNKAATARELGIHKTTLWRKMRKLNIDDPPPDQLMNP